MERSDETITRGEEREETRRGDPRREPSQKAWNIRMTTGVKAGQHDPFRYDREDPLFF